MEADLGQAPRGAGVGRHGARGCRRGWAADRWRGTALLAALMLQALPPAMAQSVPRGGANADRIGFFGPIIPWKLIPLHAALLPDGRVMSYGTDEGGNQTGKLVYEVWDPALGTGTGSHMVLPNTTGTDIFCSAQTLIPGQNVLLLAGGDNTILGQRNYSVGDVNRFNTDNNQMFGEAKMAFPRWYPTFVTLASGEIVILGGRASPTEAVTTPELYSPSGKSWRSLTGARNDQAFGIDWGNYWYPRGWQTSRGGVFVLTASGQTYNLLTNGNGSLIQGGLTLPWAEPFLPAVMYRPDRILALRNGVNTLDIDLSGMTPAATNVASVDQLRLQGNATVMADGNVLINGGSTIDNTMTGASYRAQIWNATSKSWVAAATAQRARLYHSTSLLLKDGSVLTAGGGAPGPQMNLNAEIYYPPYLYLGEKRGAVAARPSIVSAPAVATWGELISVRASTSISRITLVRVGSVTHTTNVDQRFIELTLSGDGSTRSAQLPATREIAPPGDYMMFVFNSKGVPSIAKFVRMAP